MFNHVACHWCLLPAEQQMNMITMNKVKALQGDQRGESHTHASPYSVTITIRSLVLTLQRSYALYHYHGDNEIQYLRHFCLAWLYVEKPLLMRCRVIGHLLQHWAALVHWSGMELSHRRTTGSSQPTTDKVHDKVLFRSRFHLKIGLIIASVLQNSVKHVRQLQ